MFRNKKLVVLNLFLTMIAGSSLFFPPQAIALKTIKNYTLKAWNSKKKAAAKRPLRLSQRP
jgi:hypothetical protein